MSETLRKKCLCFVGLGCRVEAVAFRVLVLGAELHDSLNPEVKHFQPSLLLVEDLIVREGADIHSRVDPRHFER